MQLTQIVATVNELLAGELLTFSQMSRHLDRAVDDINQQMNSKYPVFSEFAEGAFPDWPDYNFFPDVYIRTVVCIGAAYKYFTADEEGIATATAYGWEYKDGLFRMVRDYIDFVDPDYQDNTTLGSVTGSSAVVKLSWEDIGN
jgi:hypothetical protein